MTPEELEKLPKPLERTMSTLEMSIMQEIVERIRDTAQITPVTDHLLNRLNVIGESKSRLKKMIKESIKDTDLDIEKIYEHAVRSDYIQNKALYESVGRDYQAFEDNLWMQQVVEMVKRQTEDTLRPMENITKTTGFNVTIGNKKVFTPLSEYLERSLDKAMMGITTGTKTYSQAIGEVIDEMTASGVRTVEYASGKSDRIEVAARRAIMTGVAQMTDKVNEKNAEILETDYWEVDWHMGARNTGTGYLNHQSWQGKVYTTEEMKTVCGLGEMLGFAGINCYHIRFPFIPGVSKRKYTDEWLAEQNWKENEKKTYCGKEYDTYAALQHQRTLERTIRKWKQHAELLKVADADKDEITAARCRLKAVEQEYVRFSKEMGLRQQRERLKVGTINEKLQIEKLDGLAKYSLDDENQRKYQGKAKQWRSLYSNNEKSKFEENLPRYSDRILGTLNEKIGKFVEKDGTSDIIELQRKDGDSRENFKFLTEEAFNNLTIAARKKGAIILRGTKEVEEHLEKIGAAASNIGDVLLFRKNVCISEVLEEMHHFEQNLSKMNNDKEEPLRSILNEIDAKQYLLDNAKRFKIPRNEIELTEKQLRSYQKQLEEYMKGGR